MTQATFDSYVTRIRELEQANNALCARLKRYDAHVKLEISKIRDVWKEKLDSLKSENSRLKQRLGVQEQNISLDQDQAGLLNRYKRELYEKEALIQSQKERLKRADQIEKQMQLESFQQKQIEDLQHQLQTVLCQKEDTEVRNGELIRQVKEWRKVASAYTATGSQILEPEAFQNRLVEDQGEMTKLEVENSQLSMSLAREQKVNKECVQRLRSMERELKHSALEIDDLQKALQMAKEKETKMSSQIGVLKRCIATQMDSSTTSDTSTATESKSPFTEPAKNGSIDLDKEPYVIQLKTQLQDRKGEVDLLRKDLSLLEAKLDRVNEMEMEIQTLKAQLSRTTNVKDQLITRLQKLQVTGARSTSSNSMDAETRCCDCGSSEALQKAKDAAVRRADAAKREAKLQREVMILLVQRILGWTFNLVEDTDRFIVQLQSTYSPSMDGGWIQIRTSKSDFLQLVDKSKKRALTPAHGGTKPVALNLGTQSMVTADAECSSPVPSKGSSNEPQMEMLFTGRYLDKWKGDERWRSQLMQRKSFSTFLAFICLDEHHAHQRRKGWPQPSPSSPAAKLLEH
eukprot:Blabericola_migrator_1__5846@NODE_295_length_10235_cov_141_552026_g242_i0_p3_GENE_NODE_295_length_10235_cov_141_552026_g242_i0NODE_295_length_10235_cov_141_552026_g242_i0_p3_ORF_typecomplete_len572_score104_30MAD/PF05557_13/7_9e05CEP63/PF17045_5/1_6e03CEP63/PF17045_5/58CEP63/PF17045_5/0_0019HOOK/PF05622_12/3_1HOOK/PF05622_12/0_1Mto2_bdg/PF12808_7/42Mto2_bdg/PF12808_7/8_1Mto2_bdg/PF12808_7/13Mto2_bdg/PF12808_7/8e02Mto2_bdg/PF12808_7/1_9e02Mto2_bdg/PF12808_7/63Filament/PF00038_21/0_32Filament/PF00